MMGQARAPSDALPGSLTAQGFVTPTGGEGASERMDSLPQHELETTRKRRTRSTPHAHGYSLPAAGRPEAPIAGLSPPGWERSAHTIPPKDHPSGKALTPQGCLAYMTISHPLAVLGGCLSLECSYH
jgi:hypothetical protein